MAWLKRTDRRFLEALSSLTICNPFLPERLELERQALGNDFDDAESVWSKQADVDGSRANVTQLTRRTAALATRLQKQLSEGAEADECELALYEDLILYSLYDRFRADFQKTIEESHGTPNRSRRVTIWPDFLKRFEHFLKISGRSFPGQHEPAHMFAAFFQLRRAFYHIYHFIVGRSMPIARLRAAVWQSIFTHDLRRYRRALFRRMGDITTLISGPSGTGKELVARAIGFSRYIPFDVQSQRFSEDFVSAFYALNISALSPTLIESELFGHCCGAFTGAVSDREGWLEICRPLGTVFLDEIGELDASIQVKLLRVLQTRSFQRLGESKERQFNGKIIAATNCDLMTEIREGRFREDFYYRLCSDMITTPSLQDQLADSPDDLGTLLRFLARRVAGEESDELAVEVEAWVTNHLSREYKWPGNIRELEQCVRNVMIRREYHPPVSKLRLDNNDPQHQLLESIEQASLTADDLLRRYCTIVYAKLGSYEQTAKRLGLDRRTVKSKIDEALLDELKNDEK